MSPKLGLTQGTLLGWLTFSYSGPQTSVDIRGPDVKQPAVKIQIIGIYTTLRVVDVVRFDRS